MDEKKILLMKNRAVWNWIASWLSTRDLLSNGYHTVYVWQLKQRAILMLYPEDEKYLSRYSNCYLCAIAMGACEACPGNKLSGRHPGCCLKGLYSDFTRGLMDMQSTSLSDIERSNARDFAIGKAKAIANVGFDEDEDKD